MREMLVIALRLEANLLDVYMSRLRAKFETVPGPPVFKTLRGVGYQLL